MYEHRIEDHVSGSNCIDTGLYPVKACPALTGAKVHRIIRKR